MRDIAALGCGRAWGSGHAGQSVERSPQSMTANPHRQISSRCSCLHTKNDRPRSYLSRSDRVQFAFTVYQQVGTARGCANPLTIPHQSGTPKYPERMRSSPTMRGNADYHRYRACKGRNVATVASLGHSTCRACDAEASRDTDGRWGLDAQRRGYRSRHGPAATAAFSGARFLRTEVFVFRPQSTGALELPAVRMDNGWQTVDPAASVADTA